MLGVRLVSCDTKKTLVSNEGEGVRRRRMTRQVMKGSVKILVQ